MSSTTSSTSLSPITSTNPPVTSTAKRMVTPNNSGPFSVVQSVLGNANLYSGTAGVPPATKTQLDSLYSNLVSLNNSSGAVLNGQDTLYNIISNETGVLKGRIDKMNHDTESAKRALRLNEYSRMKSTDYNKILYYFIALMVSISIIFICKKIIPGIPNMVYETLIVVLVCLCLYFSYYKYADITRRDLIYYDELSVPLPSNVSLSDKQINAANISNNPVGAGYSGLGMCANSSCCDEVTATWDEASGRCVSIANRNITATPKSTTPTPTTTRVISGFTLMNPVEPNSYNEYQNYSPI